MTNRVSFVTNEFRTAEAPDLSVKALYPNAQVVSIRGNTDEATAFLRANEELASGAGTRVFELVVEAVYLPDTFIAAPPSFAIYSPADGLNGEVFTAFEVSEVNLELGFSTVRVR